MKVRLRTGERIILLQEELILARENLRIMALHDALTQLFNRGAILEVLLSELARAKRDAGEVAVVMGDIDHFKSVNDTYGHQAGDEVLRVISRRLKESGRSYDSVGRYGGEEFLIVVPGCSSGDALKQARRLHQAIRKEPVQAGGESIGVTMSMGVAVFNHRAAPDPDTLINSADEALYRAKERGRDRIEMGVLPQSAPASATAPACGEKPSDAPAPPILFSSESSLGAELLAGPADSD